jgi:putative nucleotidyltransferase with HDIG domain
MSRQSKIYAIIISAIGLSLGSYCVYKYFSLVISNSNASWQLMQFGVLLILYIICRCLPIYIRDDYAIDMSFICNLSAILYMGPIAATAMVLISTPFVVVQNNYGDRTLSHIFNKPPIKTAFNAGNFSISVYLSGVAYQKAGGVSGSLALPQILFPGIVAILVFFVFNCGILLMLFSLNLKTPFLPLLLKNLTEFLPNISASAPIAYFIAVLFTMKNGEYLIILIMLPLLLARYSFVLYLNAKKNYYDMVKTLTAALEAKDEYTEGHSHRVETYSEMIARQMHCSQTKIENIKVAALLHDVGKIGIDDKILNKPGPLTPEERQVIMTHPLISESILKNVKLEKDVRDTILHHHERYDGNGYPDHIKGTHNSVSTYIVGVADAYDAMTSNRPYCKSMPVEKVVSILKEESGKQFDPKVVSAFLQVLKDHGEIK